MSKCTLCVVGNMDRSGSHEFCDKCGFSRFVLTNDYMYGAMNLLAILASNVKFNSNDDFEATVERYIEMNLPQLAMYIKSIVSGRQSVMDNIYTFVKESAINLQIAEVTHQEKSSNDLICQCGCEDFKPVDGIKISQLACQACNAIYEYEEESGSYMPEFLCIQCNQAAYIEVEENLVECRGCGIAYLHDPVNDVFRMVTHGDL